LTVDEIRELTADAKGKDAEGAKGIYFVWIPLEYSGGMIGKEWIPPSTRGNDKGNRE